MRDIPKWVTNKPVVFDVKYLKTATMTRNNNKYKCCIYYNNGNVEWGFHWKSVQRKWKEKQVRKYLVLFDDSYTNLVLFLSYLKATCDNYVG